MKVGKVGHLEFQVCIAMGDTAMEDEITSSLGDDILRATAEEINSRCRLLDNDIKAMKNDASRLTHEQTNMKDRIKENDEKIKLNKQLPYLVGNIVEVIPAAIQMFLVCAISRCVRMIQLEIRHSLVVHVSGAQCP